MKHPGIFATLSVVAIAFAFLLLPLVHGANDTGTAKPVPMLKEPTRKIAVAHSYLRLPMKSNGTKRHLTVLAEGKAQWSTDIYPADGIPDWWT